MRVLLFSMELKGDARIIYQSLADHLTGEGFSLYQYNKPDTYLLDNIPILYRKEQLKELHIDLILSAGGDGTM
ncbi:MAG: hypothetical protein KA143_05215, partial [Saprospiraceae bacterium]|nr:hypothetical protein [Saprospiraceae bacterium]